MDGRTKTDRVRERKEIRRSWGDAWGMKEGKEDYEKCYGRENFRLEDVLEHWVFFGAGLDLRDLCKNCNDTCLRFD